MMMVRGGFAARLDAVFLVEKAKRLVTKWQKRGSLSAGKWLGSTVF